MAKILVVAAHPDDEVLGCGGSIAHHVDAGDEVRVIILAEGLTSRGVCTQDDLLGLAASAQAASKILGVSELYLHKFPDNRMDSVDRLDITRVVENHIKEFEPNIVYTHYEGDLNYDHRIVSESVNIACRPQTDSSVHTLLYFEIPSSTDWQPVGSRTAFTPNWFIDINGHIDKKIKALKEYESEMRPTPHSRSLESITHLAKWRGAMVSLYAAEAFVLGRRRIN